MFTRDTLLLYESYIKEIVTSDDFSVASMTSWSSAIILVNYGSMYDYYRDDYDNYSRDNYDDKRHRLTVKLHREMVPRVLKCITELYELEYKKHLIITQYRYLVPVDFPTVDRMNITMGELADFLRIFILTNIVLVRTRYADDYDNIDSSKLTLDRLFSAMFMDPIPLEEESTTFLWDMVRSGTESNIAYKKMFSKDISVKMVGITSMFNIVHDDERHLIISSGNEEYPELLIPRAQYERASRINHRKVERELKQELVGY